MKFFKPTLGFIFGMTCALIGFDVTTWQFWVLVVIYSINGAIK